MPGVWAMHRRTMECLYAASRAVYADGKNTASRTVAGAHPAQWAVGVPAQGGAKDFDLVQVFSVLRGVGLQP